MQGMTAPYTTAPSHSPAGRSARADWPRMAGWLVVAALLTVAGLALAPQQLPVSLYKLSLVTTSAVLGYWLDRGLFPYARPDALLDIEGGSSRHTISLLMSAAMLRRAIVVAATMLAVGLGA